MFSISEFIILNEVLLMPSIDKKEKYTGLLNTDFDDSVVNANDKKTEYSSIEKLYSLGKNHELYHAYYEPEHENHYIVKNKNTNKITSVLTGELNDANTFKINSAESNGRGPKMHEIYHTLLKNGHVGAFMTTAQSYGGRKIWQKLAKKRNVVVHGWDKEKEKAVPVDMENILDTHSDPGEQKQQKISMQNMINKEFETDKQYKTMDDKTKELLAKQRLSNLRRNRENVENMPLVASYIEPEKEKELMNKFKQNQLSLKLSRK